MLKQKEKVFVNKFHLLASQEYNDDIHWSSSDTTDTENASVIDKVCNRSNLQSRKRKRKKKVPKNISNLDITIIPKEAKRDKSPIISHTIDKTSVVTSPILRCSPQLRVSGTRARSKSTQSMRPDLTSPILLQKHSSPNISTKTRKKLVKVDDSVRASNSGRNSPIFTTSGSFKAKSPIARENTKENLNIVAPGRENSNLLTGKKMLQSQSLKCFVEKADKSEGVNSLTEQQSYSRGNIINSTEIKREPISHKDSSAASIENTSIIGNTSDESFMIKCNHSAELANKVKAYFDSHFSSESPSQHSITETQTPKEEKSQEIEIVSSLTQMTTSNKSSFASISKIEAPGASFDTDFSTGKTKKLKYKKEGLAHRLNVLLRKQSASFSLWQHEKYLAVSSNFEIPKGEHSVFCIRKVNYKYGCYLVDAIDVNDAEFTIAISSQYSVCKLTEDSILKVYQPFTVLELCGNGKFILNACKIESMSL